MAQEGLQLFGGDWTERKLDALDQYLRAYTKALKNQIFTRIYIDAFAGTGYREPKVSAEDTQPDIFADELEELSQPESQRFLDGSARIALNVDPPFHRFVFIESDKEKVAELETLKAKFPSHSTSIDIRPGDANVTIRNLCKTWESGTRGVLFLDPFGMQAEWSTIKAVAATGCIDTWILFPFATNRLLTKSPDDIPPGWRARLNKLFGTEEWEPKFYAKRTDVDIFGGNTTVTEKKLTFDGLGAYYHERLRGVFPCVASHAPVLRSAGNKPLFQLFFAAGNAKGGPIAMRIAGHILEKI